MASSSQSICATCSEQGCATGKLCSAKSSSFSCGDWECWLPQIDLYNGHNMVAAAAKQITSVVIVD